MVLTLAAAIANIRVDLSDTDPSALRWSDDAIAREMDRALARYSSVAPRLQLVQIPTSTYCRLYASPDGAWWVDRVEYPLGRYPRAFRAFHERSSPLIAEPSSAPAVSATDSGEVDPGTHAWAYSFTVPGGGETALSPVATFPVMTGEAVAVMVPTGPYGVTGRTVYRSRLGDLAHFFKVGSIPDNTTAALSDTLADASLGASAPTTNTTQGIPQFEVDFSPYTTPLDSAGTLEVTYATKHVLDGSGTTVPEEHHDILYAGAEAYLVEAYVAQVNDNFEWVDGQFRDRVDDTKSIDGWQSYLLLLLQRFERRLKDASDQSTDSIVPAARWGDKPYGWDRL